MHLPYPIETVYKPKVTTVNRIEVGYSSGNFRGRSQSIANEGLMLTGDENIIDISFEVKWKIGSKKDSAPNFLFNVYDPESAIKAVAESAMREVIGKSKIMAVLSVMKAEAA